MLTRRAFDIFVTLCAATLTSGQYCCLPNDNQVCQPGCTIYPAPHGANGAGADQAYCASHCGIPKPGDGTPYTPAQAIAHNQALYQCDFNTQYQTAPVTPTTLQQCSALTVCTSGEYERVAPTETSNRQCDPITQCVDGVNYQTHTATATSNTVCADVTTCVQSLTYQTIAPTITSDRYCSNVTNCVVIGSTYQFQPPTIYENMQCNNVQHCFLGLSYQTSAATATTDTVCAPVQQCSLGSTYASHPATTTTNTVCSGVTSCQESITYETSAATLTTDTVCTNVTNCIALTTYETVAPTVTSNRQCGAVTNCVEIGSTYQTSNASLVTNMACSPVTSCVLGQTFQSSAPTATTDRMCAPVSNCTSESMIAISAATLTSNAVCSSAVGRTKSSATISSGAIGGIVVVILIFIIVPSWYISKRMRRKHELEMLLAAEEKEGLAEQVERMLAAWQIPWEHVKLVSKLAEGTFGEVWTAKWSNMVVAVKLLKKKYTAQTCDPEYASAFAALDAEAAQEFEKETATLRSIKHPSLLIFFGAGTADDGRLFMVTEYLRLGALRGVLLDKTRQIDWNVRNRIALQVASGCAHLHSLSIVHRDLKSDNVLLDKNMNAKVGDFGTAKLASRGGARTGLSVSGRVAETNLGGAEMDATQGVGTPLWMAPEIFAGKVSSYGPAVDVYSYGIIMWELATRSRPWSELDDSSFIAFKEALTEALMAGRRPSLPDGIDAEHPIFVKVMRKAWATDPSERPTFSHIVFSLEMIAPEQTSSTSTVTTHAVKSSNHGNMDSLTEPLLPPE